ncbi:aldehyde dehydrogenase family protein [Mycolicibacterium sp. S2-37]|uniref:aldehyde dehydrogenase family protein n=1 Tax=Mycolicibacterium sp. S2-37 TaxID=2810297 RepID=UPI001A94EBE0|nr:aldehyde dehydrogenase family protein [Mycolicibacterium sp. S2-37]MBO0680888.1 aldehyde dehydrogenase family protein [Mycolicibacterium sp. S2-37]
MTLAVGGISTVDPATGETIARFLYTTPDELERILAKSRLTQEKWARSTVDERIEGIERLAASLAAHRERLAAQIVREMGKPITQARAEIDKCVTACDYYANHLAAILAPRPVDVRPDTAEVHLRPLGVIFAILPWNYPWWQVIRAMLPAIGAGNVVVLKHADSVTGCALTIADLLCESFAEDVLRAVVLPADRASDVIADHRIAAVTFTGSERVGALVAQAAGASLKKCVLELGGSDPFIVFDDADIAAAAEAAVRSRYINNGQSCIAAKRLIVQRSVRDELVEAMCERVGMLRVGDPTDPSTDIGPLARFDLLRTLESQRARAIADGARTLAEAPTPGGPGAWFAPTLMEVDVTSPLFTEETFGPLGALTVFDHPEQAILLANESQYGLSSSIWTTDIDRARQLAGRIEAGSVFINTISVSDPRLPVGGVKSSGYGRELAEWGVTEFANLQAVRAGMETGATSSPTLSTDQRVAFPPSGGGR